VIDERADTMTASDSHDPSAAPYFEDLRVGQLECSAPSVTLTDGLASVHRAIVGDRLRLALDATLAREVLGSPAPLAHPALVWDVAIGQSTVLTARVIANLFYRGLALRRAPVLGDTLSTSTEVVALRQTTARPGRAASGLAVMRVRSTDQAGRSVLDFWRCAMLPLRDPNGRTGRCDSFDEIPSELDHDALAAATASWRLAALAGAGGAPLSKLQPGARWTVDGGDVVSAAPELARLSLNVARVHHDRRHAHRDGQRLVYGGHTIGLAAAQATRSLPEIVTFVGWHSCEHLAAVHEGDTLLSELELERYEPLESGGALAHLRSRVQAIGDARANEEGATDARATEEGVTDAPTTDGGGVDVLDWRFVALTA
jgi:acyl dehydratase